MKIRGFWLLSLCCRESLLIPRSLYFQTIIPLEKKIRRDAFKNN